MSINALASTASPAVLDPQLAEAIRLHQVGLAGDPASVRAAEALLNGYRKSHPGDALATAYHGSAMSLLARDETIPLERMRLAKKGLGLLDEAVAAAPANRTIRMLRGGVAYRLPESYFQRTETAIEDFLVVIYGEITSPGSLPKETYMKLIRELGDSYQRLGRVSEADICSRQLQKVATSASLA